MEYTKVNFKTKIDMAMGYFISKKQEINMLENGVMIKRMAMVNIHGITGIFMMEIGLMITYMGKENMIILEQEMVIRMKVLGFKT